jgi:hypothetical protein
MSHTSDTCSQDEIAHHRNTVKETSDGPVLATNDQRNYTLVDIKNQ